MVDQQRVVYAGHGPDIAMGYKFRARIEDRYRNSWFGFGARVQEFRYVIERHFMGWKDHRVSGWTSCREDVVQRANERLDEISAKPNGEYV